ncbi:MAG: M48 family metalloprotease [Deltaproteobacteria bacterium]|jgi:predicted Zn-dependent protease|nr:M48 family metalloprotease [Deltaproteobacteria bacterium]
MTRASRPGPFLAALVHGLCLALLLLAPRPALAIGQQEEIEIGRQVQAQIASQGVLFEDPIVNDYFRRVCARILKAAGPQPFPFHFYVIRSNFLNAFAVPGGYVYLHSETINSLENEGQMAAILSHEVAHITSRHFARRSDAAKSATLLNLAGLLAGIALAGAGGGGQNTAALGQALMIGTTGASIQAMLANSRADETEADSRGRSYLIKAGYSPRDMFGAFKVMNEQSYQLTGSVPGYLSTHPGLTSRLASTFADQASAPPAPRDEAYLAIRDRVLALTALTSRARKIFSKRLSENPSDASALHGLGLVALREMDYSLAQELMDKAVALAPGSGEYQTDLGELALKRRQPEAAARHFEAARQKGHDSVQTALGLARAYELSGRTKDASRLYELAAGGAGDYFPAALEQAGLFFGQNGQLAKGHFLLSSFYEATGRPKDSIFHCKAALDSPGGGNYQGRCDRRTRDLEEFMENSRKMGIGLKGRG